jgi:hypothetical protein
VEEIRQSYSPLKGFQRRIRNLNKNEGREREREVKILDMIRTETLQMYQKHFPLEKPLVQDVAGCHDDLLLPHRYSVDYWTT